MKVEVQGSTLKVGIAEETLDRKERDIVQEGVEDPANKVPEDVRTCRKPRNDKQGSTCTVLGVQCREEASSDILQRSDPHAWAGVVGSMQQSRRAEHGEASVRADNSMRLEEDSMPSRDPCSDPEHIGCAGPQCFQHGACFELSSAAQAWLGPKCTAPEDLGWKRSWGLRLQNERKE